MFQSAEITLKYHTLFTIELNHSYYTNPLSNDFAFIPTYNTNILLQKMNGIVKQSTAQIRLLYDSDRIEGLAKFFEQNEGIRFSFWVVCKNLYFTNYTQMSHMRTGGNFYFKNSPNNALLHQGNFINSEDYHQIAPSFFTYNTQEGNDIIVEDSENNIVFETKATHEKVQVDLRNVNEGLYHLKEGGEIQETFLYYKSKPPITPLGLVDLWLNDDWKSAILSNFNKEEPAKTEQFKIQFGNRATYWRYYVILRFQKNGEENSFSITSENNDLLFEHLENFKMPNNEEALVFCSTEPIPLQEAPKLGLKLSLEKKNKGTKVLKNHLPTPSIQSIKPESVEEGAKIYSDVIIYL